MKCRSKIVSFVSRANYLTWLSGVLFSLGLLFWWGCTPGNKGVYPDNKLPIIRFVNVPPESTYWNVAPVVNWYATDPDGYISEYRYAVVTTLNIIMDVRGVDSATADAMLKAGLPTLVANGLADSLINVKKHDLLDSAFWVWTRVDNVNQNGSSVKVKLFATLKPGEYLDQYVFVQAVDNVGARTDIVFKRFYRTNNAPNTGIIMDSLNIFYSLDTITTVYRGITIGWAGSDSIDFPINPPPFDFRWALYGPFDTKPRSLSDTAGKPNILIVKTDTMWQATSITFPGMVPLFGGNRYINLATGWYLFTVQARDDGLVLDTTPAVVRFRVIKPTFERKMLLVDDSRWKRFATQSSGGLLGSPFGSDFPAARDSCVRFYKNIFEKSGYNFVPARDYFYINDSLPGSPQYLSPPSESLLSMYQLVAYFSEHLRNPITDTIFIQIKKYLDAGGMVWIIGRDRFLTRSQRLAGFDPRPGKVNAFGTDSIPLFYWDIQQQFFQRTDLLIDKPKNEQFIGARPLPEYIPGYPLLEIDPVKVRWYMGYPDSIGGCKPGIRIKYCPFDRLMGVNYDVRGLKATPLYLFISAFPDTSHLEGRVVATRNNGPLMKGKTLFRAANFNFGLFVLKDAQAEAVVQKMLHWFFDEPNLP